MDCLAFTRAPMDRSDAERLARERQVRIVERLCEAPLPFPGAEDCMGPELLQRLARLGADRALLIAGPWTLRHPLLIATLVLLAERNRFELVARPEVVTHQAVQLHVNVQRLLAASELQVEPATLIAQWTLERRSSRWIVAELARRRIAGPRGGPFSRTTVRRLQRLTKA